MERRTFLKATGIALGTIGSAGCSSPSANPSGGETTNTPGGQAGPPTGNSTEVLMITKGSEYYFDPIGLFIEPGTTVTWKIDSQAHSSTAYEKGNGPAEVTRIPNGADAWNSGVLSERGATFEHTFDVEGTYDYYCIPHKSLGMVGRIVVGSPGGPAEGSMPPDGEVPKSDRIVDQGAIAYGDFK